MDVDEGGRDNGRGENWSTATEEAWGGRRRGMAGVNLKYSHPHPTPDRVHQRWSGMEIRSSMATSSREKDLDTHPHHQFGSKLTGNIQVTQKKSIQRALVSAMKKEKEKVRSILNMHHNTDVNNRF